MATAQALTKMSFADYVVGEDASPVKREWVNGEAWAMSGGSIEHGALGGSIHSALLVALRGRPCKPFNSDVRIRVQKTGLAAYPDVSVVCGKVERDPEDDCAIVNATVLIEVLSPSTEDWDRGGKWNHYRQMPSLRHYVLFEQDQRRVEFHTRQADGTWNLRDLGLGECVELTALSVTLDIDALYEEALAGLG